MARIILLNPSVAQLVERLTVVYTYCVSVYSEINWSLVRFRSLGDYCQPLDSKIESIHYLNHACTYSTLFGVFYAFDVRFVTTVTL